MKLNSKTDFFRQASTAAQPEQPQPEQPQPEQPQRMVMSGDMATLIKQAADVLTACGFARLAESVSQVEHDIRRERFVVSVVGEFNHGKSTFLNRLLDNAACLPVADLPTTAVTTRIRYARKPQMAVFDKQGTQRSLLPVAPSSWKGLVADNFGGKEPEGSVVVGIANPWLGRNSLEFVDCPGAGDLSEQRAQIIGDVLRRTDGAIIALNATAALSSSERLFIKNRILSRSTPFTLIVVNKLDLVRREERSRVMKYIHDVLQLHHMSIPVYVPYAVEMPDTAWQDIIGLDKVRAAIEAWTRDPGRQQRIAQWARARLAEIAAMAVQTVEEQERMLRLDDGRRQEAIETKKRALRQMELEWDDLALQLQERSNACYSQFVGKAGEYATEIAERLQYEAAHANQPERWWKEDYPYRLKVELANAAVGLENTARKTVDADTRWFNQLISQKFRSSVDPVFEGIADKDEYKSHKSDRQLEFENLTKKQNYARVGTVVLSLALAPAFGLLATMGVGTAGTLVTTHLLKKKIEEQRTAIREAIARDVPSIVMKATSDSEKRIAQLYATLLADSDRKRQAWADAQTAAIVQGTPDTAADALRQAAHNKEQLTTLINRIS